MPLSIAEARLGAGRIANADPRQGYVSSVLPARRIDSRTLRPGNHRIACDDMEVEDGVWKARGCFHREPRRHRWRIAVPVPQEDHHAFPKSEASVAHESQGGVPPCDCKRFSLFPSILTRYADATVSRPVRLGHVAPRALCRPTTAADCACARSEHRSRNGLPAHGCRLQSGST